MGRLKAFMYLLMRDHLPTGVVAKVVQDIEKSDAVNFRYTSQHLANLAEEMASRLLTNHNLAPTSIHGPYCENFAKMGSDPQGTDLIVFCGSVKGHVGSCDFVRSV